MDKFVKTLKTTKRRISQQLKVATGHAEMTTDAAFDQAYRNFTDLENNLKLLSSQCVSIINNVDNWCDTNRKLADELLHFTMKSEVETADMNTYKETINNIHIALQAEYDFTRRAIICVLRSHIIVRIEGLLEQDFAAVEKIVKTRRNILTDYDSHRSKCSMFEKKGDTTNAEKFRMKMDHDHKMLQEHTAYLQNRFKELIAIGSAILSQETATLVACEMYLVERQSEAMTTISSSFPQSSIEGIMSGLEALSDRIKDGEDVEREYTPPEIALPSFPYVEPPVVTDYRAASSESHYEHPLPPLPSVPSVPPTQGEQRKVKALYSLDAAAPGELSFKEGDWIEVVREDPSGWWEGRLNGETGRFPFNYTQACSPLCWNKWIAGTKQSSGTTPSSLKSANASSNTRNKPSPNPL